MANVCGRVGRALCAAAFLVVRWVVVAVAFVWFFLACLVALVRRRCVCCGVRLGRRLVACSCYLRGRGYSGANA